MACSLKDTVLIRESMEPGQWIGPEAVEGVCLAAANPFLIKNYHLTSSVLIQSVMGTATPVGMGLPFIFMTLTL